MTGLPTITAFEHSPDGGQGRARDMRVRWALEEVGQPYRVRPVSCAAMKGPTHRAPHPFGQIPTFEDGAVTLFETDAIVLRVASRPARAAAGGGGAARARTISWMFAALSTMEPYLSAVAEVAFFTKDETLKALRQPVTVAAAKERLGKLTAALGDRPYLVGDDFTAADLMLALMPRVGGHADLLADMPNLAAYRARGLDRPAFRKAVADQRRYIAAHGPRDMGWDPAIFAESAAKGRSTRQHQGGRQWNRPSTSSSGATASRR